MTIDHVTDKVPSAVSASQPAVKQAFKRPLKTRSTSKTETLIRLVSTAAGADLASLGRKLGWQPHTIRAAISRLRKTGHDIVVERPADGKPRRYRMLADAGQAPEGPGAQGV